MAKQFCVYIHKRPNGEPFYIGKGLLSRAYDFAPSRRTEWHKNIVKKYGRDNIIVHVIPCMYEKEAFELEQVHIKIARENGYKLANLTDGGEGASGRFMTDKQKEGLEKGRRIGKKGTKGSRPQLVKWLQSDAGKEHLKRLSLIGSQVLHAERNVECAECGEYFITKSAKAKCCSRLCEQRNRRAKQKYAK
jgi:formylmethanofuran dehydrogenase subunit E